MRLGRLRIIGKRTGPRPNLLFAQSIDQGLSVRWRPSSKNDFGTKPLHVCWIQYSYNIHKRPFCELDFLKTGEYVDYHRCRTFSCSGFCACKQTLCDVDVGVPVTEAGAALGEIDVHATRHKPCFSPHCDASLLLLLPQLGSFVLYTSSFCFQPT